MISRKFVQYVCKINNGELISKSIHELYNDWTDYSGTSIEHMENVQWIYNLIANLKDTSLCNFEIAGELININKN